MNMAFPRWLSGKESACQRRRPGCDPWVGKIPWRRPWQPTPVFWPGESRDRGAWWAAIYGVTQSRTWLKRLSSSSKQLRLSPVAFLCPVFHNVFLMHHIVTHLCKEYNTFLRTKRVHSLCMLSVCRLYTTWANVADLGKAAATLMLWDSLWNGKNYENPRLDMKSYKVDHFNAP